MQKMKLYMRAVVVTALLVVGGLGIYKGRGYVTGAKSATAPTGAAASEKVGDKAVAKTDVTASSAATTEKAIAKPADTASGGWWGWLGWNSTKPKPNATAAKGEPAAEKTAQAADAAKSLASKMSSTPAASSPKQSLLGSFSASKPKTEDGVGANSPPPAPKLGGFRFASKSNDNAASSSPATASMSDDAAPPAPPSSLRSNTPNNEFAPSTPVANTAENNFTPLPNHGDFAATPNPPPSLASTPNNEFQPNPLPVEVASPADNRGSQFAPANSPAPLANLNEGPPAVNIAANAGDFASSAAPPMNENNVPSASPVEVPPVEVAPPAAPSLTSAPATSNRFQPNPLPNGTSLANGNNAGTSDRFAQPTAPRESFAPTTSFASDSNRSSDLPSAAAMAANALMPNTLEAALTKSVAPTKAPSSPRYAEETPLPATPAGVPVDPQLQGPQAPSIVLEKFAPPEVQVGKPAVFEIQVKNVGPVPAYDVLVVDELPQGTRFQDANPPLSHTQGNKLVWKLGMMKPGQETIIEVRLVPEAEGEIGSVAQVSFQAQIAAKSVVTRPKLELGLKSSSQVHAGENVSVVVVIANNGSGAASNVLLESDIPKGLIHPAGDALEFQVGTLRPGESKQVELVMKADQAGDFECPVVVRGDGDLRVQDVARVRVVAPQLAVQVQGPKKRFVDRQATHTLTVANPGTASARDIEMMVRLPRGFKFVSADHNGQYDARQHAVAWGLEELPAGASGNVQLTTLPVEPGDQKFLVETHGASGVEAQAEMQVAVEATQELPFTVADLADPIEVGADTTYEIRVANNGGKEATNVRVFAQFPAELQALEGDGATKATIAGPRVDFAPVTQIGPGGEAVFRIQARGLRAGDHRIAVTVQSDDHPTPVTREESTHVYVDR